MLAWLLIWMPQDAAKLERNKILCIFLGGSMWVLFLKNNLLNANKLIERY
jgi:hypothetical protein